MSPALTVSLNRDRLHDVSVARSYTTDDAFYVELDNEGEAVHIHLHLDDTLSRVARLEAGNHYVETGGTAAVRVDVDTARVAEPVSGTLRVVTGYGAEEETVEVTVEPYTEANHSVQVDESLGTPRATRHKSEPETASLTDRLGDAAGTGSVPLVVFALFATALAVAVAVVLDSTAVFIGVGVVIGGVLAALAMQLL